MSIFNYFKKLKDHMSEFTIKIKKFDSQKSTDAT